MDPVMLARVAHHELAGALAMQHDVLGVARARLQRCGEDCAEVDLAREQVRDMLDVVDLLSALAEPTTGCRTGTLGEVVERVGRSWSPLHVRLSAAAARADVDAHRLPTVLTNVVANARTHGPAGSAVDLVGGVRGGRLLIDLRHQGRSPRGAAEFLSAQEPPAGRRGLGLWLVRRLVQQMDGSVRLVERADASAWILRLSVPRSSQPRDSAACLPDPVGQSARTTAPAARAGTTVMTLTSAAAMGCRAISGSSASPSWHTALASRAGKPAAPSR